MSDATPQSQEYPVQPAQKNKAGSAIARISLTQLTLAVLVLVFLWQWLDGRREINEMQQQLAARIAEMDGNNKANQVLLAHNQEQMRELFAKVTILESRYTETQNQRAGLEALYNNLSENRIETVLAEVEQMLLIASQQLQLSANVKAALIAMQSADARLQRINRPALNDLRKAINQDMEKLRAMPKVDVTGINLQLNDLMAAVDELPLTYQQRGTDQANVPTLSPKDEKAWQKLMRDVWQELKQLVRIENTGKDEIPLLSPNQEFFLRENLKLRLLTARIALLTRDSISYRQELKTAQIWTMRYFDGTSVRGERMLAALKKLSETSIHVEMPDISPSLQAVRNFRLSLEKVPKSRR
jgi:uroporphyrin-III C-methyltransferase